MWKFRQRYLHVLTVLPGSTNRRPLLAGTHVNWPPGRGRARIGEQIRATVDGLADRRFGAFKFYSNATPGLVAAACDQAHAICLRVLGHLERPDWPRPSRRGSTSSNISQAAFPAASERRRVRSERISWRLPASLTA